jgi:hypothetical protein
VEIKRLALANTLCDDAGDDELALHQYTLPSSSHRDLRRSEYKVLVEELAVGIEQTPDALSKKRGPGRFE